jgi:prepilin-type processing-associated H-X9-DG protein
LSRRWTGSGHAVHNNAGFAALYPGLAEPPVDAFYLAVFDAARTIIHLLPDEIGEDAPTFPSGPGNLAVTESLGKIPIIVEIGAPHQGRRHVVFADGHVELLEPDAD